MEMESHRHRCRRRSFHTAWVKNGSVRTRAARPFYPQEQTSSACPGMSVWCQYQTLAAKNLLSRDVLLSNLRSCRDLRKRTSDFAASLGSAVHCLAMCSSAAGETCY